MQIELPYGETTMTAELPAGTRMLSNVERAALSPVEDLDTAVRAALATPHGLPRIGALVRPGSPVTIAFDDHTTGSFGPIRPTAIRAVLDELAAAGVNPRDVTLVCANALHRMLRPAELARLLGDDLVREFGPRLICHDAEDPEQIVDLGITAEHGYPVEVHRLVAESDLTVYVNTNYIRGFTGGWKSVCVGLSTWRTIRVTHTPDGMSMSVHRNRMHAVLDEMGHHLEARLGKRIFKIDTLLADPHRPARIFAGAVDETRRAALEAQAELYPPRREASAERVDVLVYGVPDSSPYAIFASVNPILTLVSSGLGYLGGMIEAVGKPGCTVIMAAPARDTWDRVAHPSYLEVWERILPQTRDPVRDHRALRRRSRAASRVRRGLSPALCLSPDPRHPRDASAQAAAPRGSGDRRRARGAARAAASGLRRRAERRGRGGGGAARSRAQCDDRVRRAAGPHARRVALRELVP